METESRDVPFSCFHFTLSRFPCSPFCSDCIYASGVSFILIGFYFYFQPSTTQTSLPTNRNQKTHNIYHEQQNTHTHTFCFCLLYSVIYFLCIIIQTNMMVFCVVGPDVQTLSDVSMCTALFTRDSEESVKKVTRHCGSPGV